MRRQTRDEKRLQALDRRERAFRARLLPRLRDCEAGYGTLLFLTDDRVAPQLPRYARDPDADELFAEASAIVAERIAMALESACLAEQYLAACERTAESDNEHRLGPRRLATELLRWLGRHPAMDRQLEVGP